MTTHTSPRTTMKTSSKLAGLLGLALGAAGLAAGSYGPEARMTAWLLGGAGVALVAWFAVAERRLLLRAPGTRAARYGANAAAVTLAFMGILVLLNVLAVRHNARWDATTEKSFTLSTQAVKVLRGLKDDVTATAFYQEGAEDREKMRRLLRRCSEVSPRLKVEFVDPDKNPELAKRLGIRVYGTTVFERGAHSQQATEATEEAVVNALVRVSRDEKKTVGFLAGHGEHLVQDTGRTGLFKAKEALESQGYATVELNVLPRDGVPKDCAVLVVAGPMKPLLASEVQALRAYLDGGGRVLLLLEPGDALGLEPLLAEWGVRLRGDSVVDAASPVSGASYLTLLVTRYLSHDLTRDFRMPALVNGARSVDKVDPLPQGITYTPLAQSDPQSSWGETDPKSITALLKGEKSPRDVFDERVDLPGPVTLLALFERKEVFTAGPPKASGQLLVVGDSDFADNSYFGFLGNGDLFQNMVSYLAREDDLISIRPRDTKPTPLTLTRAQGATLFYATVVLGPLALILSGLAIWWKRKNL